MTCSKERKSEYVFFSIMFLLLMLFFSYINPLVLYDGDDWQQLSFIRKALPQWHGWNPVKVLPETLMPIAGSIAAYVVRPFVQDYVFSVTLTSAFIVSAFVTVYFAMFYRIAREKLGCNVYSGLSVLTIIFALHFLIFRSAPAGNTFMFYSCNLICYYHYVIPDLLNTIMVMYFYLNDNLKNISILSGKGGWILFGVYLSIFSNVFASIILASYVSFVLINDFIKLRKNGDFKEFIKEHILFIGILAVWEISLIFEANGGRSSAIGASLWALPIGKTIATLGAKLATCSKIYLGYVALSFVMLCFLYKQKKLMAENSHSKILAFSLWGIVITCIYTVLVSAKASVGYIYREDVLFGMVFYIFLILFYIAITLLKEYPQTKAILPIFMFVILFGLFDVKQYKATTMGDVHPARAAEIDNYLIKQIQQAEAEGKKEMVLIVPKGDNRDNWPHPNYMGKNICKTLKSHGLIHTDIKITIQPDETIKTK